MCSILLKVFDQSSKDFGNYRLVNKEIERISKSTFVLKKSTNWCLLIPEKSPSIYMNRQMTSINSYTTLIFLPTELMSDREGITMMDAVV